MITLGNIALSLKDQVYALKSDYNVFISHSPPPSLALKVLASRPVVDTAILLFIRCRREEFGQFLDTGRPYASTRLFLNVL